MVAGMRSELRIPQCVPRMTTPSSGVRPSRVRHGGHWSGCGGPTSGRSSRPSWPRRPINCQFDPRSPQAVSKLPRNQPRAKPQPRVPPKAPPKLPKLSPRRKMVKLQANLGKAPDPAPVDRRVGRPVQPPSRKWTAAFLPAPLVNCRTNSTPRAVEPANLKLKRNSARV
jgi:hypothetical protein